MAVEFKPGVNFEVIPQIRDAVSKIEHIFAQAGYIPLITSAKDSKHGAGSLHYIGAAIDIRSKGLPAQVKNSIFSSIRSTFPSPTWFTDFEFPGGSNEHFHVGYNPARRAEIELTDFGYGYVPINAPNLSIDTGDYSYEPDPEAPYPAYPSGVIPKQYFTPYEMEPGWFLYVGIALFAVVLWYAIDD